MPEKLRYYLATTDGLRRIPQQLMKSLYRGRGLSGFAGTTQKIAAATFEIKNRKPVRILRVAGAYVEFDEAGTAHESLIRVMLERLTTADRSTAKATPFTSTTSDNVTEIDFEKYRRERALGFSTRKISN